MNKENGLYFLDIYTQMYKKEDNIWYCYSVKDRKFNKAMHISKDLEKATVLGSKTPKDLEDLFELRKEFIKRYSRKLITREFNNPFSKEIKKSILVILEKSNEEISIEKVEKRLSILKECEEALDYINIISERIDNFTKIIN